MKQTIDFGFTRYRMKVTIYPEIDDYTINVFCKNGEVLFGWISGIDQIGNKRKYATLAIHKSIEPIRKYVELHNEFYKTDLTTSDFEKQMREEYVVGFGCGEAGQVTPKASRKATVLYEQRNVKKINKLLTSFSPELQTLGAIGLMKTKLLDDNSTRIINHLKNRNSAIYSCIGCLYGIGETFNERVGYYEKN